jgi:hypothetical protein
MAKPTEEELTAADLETLQAIESDATPQDKLASCRKQLELLESVRTTKSLKAQIVLLHIINDLTIEAWQQG